MKRHAALWVASAVVLTALAVVSLASGRQQVFGGTFLVTGDNKDYMLAITNPSTSTEPVKCWRWTLGQGALVTAAARVPDWQLGLNQPAPAPIIGGKALGGGIAPGATQAFRILTDKPFDGNGSPGRVDVSSDCVSDVQAEGDFGSPPKPVPKPLPPAKCDCVDLTASTRGVSIGQTSWAMTIDWVLKCTGTAGVKCKGEIRDFGWVGNAQILTQRPRPKKKGDPVTVTCNGKCSKKPTKGSVRVSGSTKSKAFRTNVRGGVGTYTFSFRTFCNGKPRSYGVRVAFNAKGRLDRKKSDLNANGVPDGQEKKKR